jgi:PBP1b-binding outer membrane lipoprotein LpoB
MKIISVLAFLILNILSFASAQTELPGAYVVFPNAEVTANEIDKIESDLQTMLGPQNVIETVPIDQRVKWDVNIENVVDIQKIRDMKNINMVMAKAG